MGTEKTVLCVSGEEVALRFRKMLLEHEGYRVLLACDEVSAAQLLRSHPVDVVVLDYRSQDPRARLVAEKIRAAAPAIPLIILSFGSVCPRELQGMVDAHVSKNQNPDVLLRRMQQLLARRARRKA